MPRDDKVCWARSRISVVYCLDCVPLPRVAEKVGDVSASQPQTPHNPFQGMKETLKKQRAEARAAELARQEENRRRLAYGSACSHGGWWDEVQVRTACPECYDVWNYLLQCPSCRTKACPRCQTELRPRFSRNTARPSRGNAPRPKSSGSHSYYDDGFIWY